MFTIIRFNYEVNKELITELFCINKEKPMTMCYGKCYLKDKLEDAKQDSEDSNFQTTEIIQILEESYSLHTVPDFFELESNFLIQYVNFYKSVNLSTTDHPPQTFC